MKKYLLASFFIIMLCNMACKRVFVSKNPANDATSTFEYLWQEVKTKYSFLAYKKVDWEAIHAKYSSSIYDGMSQEELFKVCAAMLNELKDGHVNLIAPFDVSYYQPLFLDSPENYDARLVLTKYLLRNPDEMQQTGALENTIIDTLGLKIAYIRYSSFSDNLLSSDLDYVFNKIKNCDGLVLDLRSNGGGSSANIFTLASRLSNETKHVYTSYTKNGPGLNDFDNGVNINVVPNGSYNFTKRIAILSNRGSFSATSFFCLAMKNYNYVRLIGDTTGGGLGIPNGGQLPNGWTYRFSVTKTITTAGENFENGVPPNIVKWIDNSVPNQYDAIIERGFEYIKNGN